MRHALILISLFASMVVVRAGENGTDLAPEPSTIVLAGLGAAILFWGARRRR